MHHIPGNMNIAPPLAYVQQSAIAFQASASRGPGWNALTAVMFLGVGYVHLS